MDKNRITDKQIDQFILGRMNKKDSADLQEYLEKDTELSMEVSKRKKLAGGVKAYGRKQLKESLKTIHKQEIVNAKPTAITRSLKKYLAIAASLLILVVAGYWLVNQNTIANPSQIAEVYFEKPTIAFSQRNAGDEQLLVIEKLYKEQKYNEAIPLLESQLESLDPDPSDLLLALGISKMENGDPASAIQFFNQIIKNKDFNFEEEAKWYAGLAHLKLGDKEAAKPFFKSLIEDASTNHYKEALELLETLD